MRCCLNDVTTMSICSPNVSNVMKLFGFLSFFVILKISFPNKYYYKKGEETKIDDTNPIFKAEDNIKKVVIDLGGFLYVASVKSFHVEGRTIVPKVYSYYVSVSAENFECTHIKEEEDWNFECNRISALIIIEGDSIQGSYTLVFEDAHFENYLGCFEAGKISVPPIIDKVGSVGDCLKKCPDDSFYGIGGDKCYCLKNTKELVSAKISLCDELCKKDHFSLCGGKESMSVYVKDGVLHKAYSTYEPSFDCIYDQKDCPVCPAGRKGPRCKVINCQDNNGDCGLMECDGFAMKFALISACVCKEGYDENVTCLGTAKDALFTKEMMYIAAIGLAAVGLIGLLIGLIFMVKGLGQSSEGSSSSS